MLFIGRIIGGIAYSILFTSFEAWAVKECNSSCDSPLLPRLFGHACFANAAAAVVAGTLGHASGMFDHKVMCRWTVK